MTDLEQILKVDVGRLADEYDRVCVEVLEQVAHLVVGYAQIYVHVDTGSLRDSIRVERGGEGLAWRQFRVRAGGYIVNPKTGRLVDYAAIVEAKYPYLQPALEMAAPELVNTLFTELSRLPGVEDVSIEGNEVVVGLRTDTSRVMTPLREMESVASRTARILTRMSGSDSFDAAMAKAQSLLMTLRMIQFSIHAIEVASGPIGWLYAGITAVTAAIYAYDSMQGM
jgi:hypothetical protein